MAERIGGIDPAEVVAHVAELLAGDGRLHLSGCRVCNAVERLPLDEIIRLVALARMPPYLRSQELRRGTWTTR